VRLARLIQPIKPIKLAVDLLLYHGSGSRGQRQDTNRTVSTRVCFLREEKRIVTALIRRKGTRATKQHGHDLSMGVDARIVVVMALWVGYTIAHKYHWGSYLDRIGCDCGMQQEIVVVFQRTLLVSMDNDERGILFDHFRFAEGDFLDESIGQCGLQPERFKVAGNIQRRDLLASRCSLAPFQQAVGQEPNMRSNPVRRDLPQGSIGGTMRRRLLLLRSDAAACR